MGTQNKISKRLDTTSKVLQSHKKRQAHSKCYQHTNLFSRCTHSPSPTSFLVKSKFNLPVKSKFRWLRISKTILWDVEFLRFISIQSFKVPNSKNFPF